MTRGTLLGAAALVLMGWATDAQAQYGPSPPQLVGAWYKQYLGRCADPCGLRSWSHQLQCGKPPECVLAGLLGSDEYYQRHGCCPTGFIKGLYKDHLGRCPSACEVRDWACELRRCCGNRGALAKKFLCASQRELALRYP